MGCDIHVHQEVKIKGKWQHYAKLSYVPRCYDMFARMADVRNYNGIEPISVPRGIPDDCTEMTRFSCDWDGSDGHSHSWLNAEEIHNLGQWVNWSTSVGSQGTYFSDAFGYLFGNSWGGFWKYKHLPSTESGIPDGVEDVRWIFWFDN